jgi:hypothetical protein
MLFTILLLLSGLTLSAVAIYYSVIGLTSIFSAAFWPIVVMGTTLEVSKLVAASWLKFYWTQIPRMMKLYMTTAVIVLMVITSMGIFGFLSKAHSDQSLVSGDVQAQIAVYDEKIKTERENIDAARKALTQMDAQVNERLSRSTDDRGAERAVQIRRQQQAERTRLQNDISRSQSAIAKLNEERAPIAAEVRKVEAEVGPIKYIAAFIYGDNPDANLLEKAVTWVIVIIVAVFDPLAVLMLLGAQMTLVWHREKMEGDSPRGTTEVINSEPPTVTPATVAANDDIDIVAEANAKIAEIEPEEPVWPTPSPHWPFPKAEKMEEISPRDLDLNEAAKEEPTHESLRCYKCDTELVDAPGIGPFCPNKQCDVLDSTSGETIAIAEEVKDPFDVTAHAKTYKQSEEEIDIVEEVGVDAWNKMLADAEDAVEAEKAAMRRWKEEHPDDTIKNARQQKELGIISDLPWQEPESDDSKKKTTYIMKDGNQQVKKTRD